MLMTKLWYSKSPLAYLLTPFSGLYRLALQLKQLSYKIGLKKTTHFPVPIIIVGNLTVGGTGKTPFIIKLAQFLVTQGYKPGIVSRGYGGQAQQYPQWVTAESDPYLVGDEPVLIAHHTLCPVVVDPNRVAAVQALLKHNHCDVILSDDGLQHTALGRNIEIVIIDGVRRFGNSFCLPAGPLREPLQRLQKVDFLVGRDQANQDEWLMQYLPQPITQLLDAQKTLNIAECHQPVHAVAGIGNPEPFFAQLRSLGLSIIEHRFPDHYRYRRQDINFGEAPVIMTEKDAVKCRKFANQQHWYLPIVAECGDLPQHILRKLIETSNHLV